MSARKKVFLYDYPNYRTTRHWKDYLQENHDLVTDMYFNPVYAEWADVIWMEWCEGAAIESSQRKGHFDDVYDHAGLRGEHNKTYSGDFDWSKSKIFIRPIDIDIHVGHFRGVKWENIDGMCYIAPHFGRMLRDGMTYPEKLPIHETRLSVRLDEWKYREHSPGGNIAWVNHNWSAKNLPAALYALKSLNDKVPGKYHLHVVENGKSNEAWYHAHTRHMLKSLGLESHVTLYQSVASIDTFLDDMDYLWGTSMKEGFSLIMGEALAKGIKALTLNWESADAIWPKDLVCDTPEDLVAKTLDPEYDSARYRSIAEGYSHEKEIAQLRSITGL